MATQIISGSVFLRLMSASVVVANRAGNIIRNIMKSGNLGIVEKGINDIQTEADRAAQRCIVNSLLKEFPKITVIGEEDKTEAFSTSEKSENEEEIVSLSNCEGIDAKCPEYLASIKEDDIVVWVDPMDGTAEYTQGLLDHVTVMIGLAVNGTAVGGVINQPFFNYQEEDSSKLGRTMWGIVGVGGFGIEHVYPPENKRIITTTRSHSNPIVQSTVSALKPDEVLKVGGSGHKVLLLIEGKAHAYVFASKGTKKWDTCAPEALLHAFGGKLTDIHGTPLQYHSTVQHLNATGVLATYSKSVHEWYAANIPKETKDALQ